MMMSDGLGPDAPDIPFAEVREYWASKLLDTRCVEFIHASGIHGLATIDPAHLEVVAVTSNNPGNGEFRAFVAAAKRRFPVVTFWAIWEPVVESALKRYGFVPCEGKDHGMTVFGMRWNREEAAPVALDR